MPGRPAAFFDFDKTLVAAETSKLIVRYLWDHPYMLQDRRVPWLYLLRLFIINEIYMLNLYPDVKMAMLMLQFFKGRKPATFEESAPDLYERYIKPRISPVMFDKLTEHKRQGYALVLISGGVRFPLEPVAADLGFDHLRCTELEIGGDGRFTGRPAGPICVREEKCAVMRELASRYNLDLQASHAYGNHESDIPMLELVGHAHVINPTRRLRRTAMRNNWPILYSIGV